MIYQTNVINRFFHANNWSLFYFIVFTTKFHVSRVTFCKNQDRGNTEPKLSSKNCMFSTCSDNGRANLINNFVFKQLGHTPPKTIRMHNFQLTPQATEMTQYVRKRGTANLRCFQRNKRTLAASLNGI